MSILVYCIAEESASLDVGSGVADRPVLRRTQAGLDALFSRNTSTESWTGASLKQSAREFHNVLHRTFASRAIVPFRFPTLMQDEDALAAHLRDNAAEYMVQLKRFGQLTQMEVSIHGPEPVSPNPLPASGADYLRSRQRRSDALQGIAKQIQELTGERAQSWHDRPASNVLKLFALVHRGSVDAFRERLKGLSVPQNLNVRVSGPWPVTEFLELKQR
jgi:hypothetical protein